MGDEDASHRGGSRDDDGGVRPAGAGRDRRLREGRTPPDDTPLVPRALSGQTEVDGFVRYASYPGGSAVIRLNVLLHGPSSGFATKTFHAGSCAVTCTAAEPYPWCDLQGWHSGDTKTFDTPDSHVDCTFNPSDVSGCENVSRDQSLDFGALPADAFGHDFSIDKTVTEHPSTVLTLTRTYKLSFHVTHCRGERFPGQHSC